MFDLALWNSRACLLTRPFFVLVLLVFCLPSYAKVTQTISAKEYEKLEKVQSLIEGKKYSDAKKILDEMRKKPKLNNYTRAQIANFTGFYYYDQGDYKSALTEYLSMVKDPTGIPDGVYNQTFFTIAQLYFQLENYKSALNYARKWFATTDNPPADAYMLIGQAYYMLNDYDRALPEVKKGIQLYEAEGKKPKENWLVLLRGIYYEKNDNKNMLPVVQKLLKLYPKPDYLFALASVYSNLGDNAKMTAVLEAMYEAGLLKGNGKQILNLANLYMLQNAPFKAALILDDAIKAGEVEKVESSYLLLAQAYMLSKDYKLSLSPMEKAASLSNNPKHYFNLGQSYSFLNRPDDAERSFKRALKLLSGKPSKEKEPIEIALGMVLTEQEKFSEAKKLFESVVARNADSKMARRWLSYIESEQIRIKKINEPVIVKAVIDS